MTIDSVFSRLSTKTIQKQQALLSEGFKSSNDKNLHTISSAISDGFYEGYGVKVNIEPINFVEEFKKLGDGEIGIALVKRDKQNETIEPFYTFTDEAAVATLLLKMNAELVARCKPKKPHITLTKADRKKLVGLRNTAEKFGVDVSELLDL